MDKRGLTVNTSGGKLLLVADTHVGLEFELQDKGVRVPIQTGKIVENIIKWAEDEGATRLAILGDVKHEIPYPVESLGEVKSFIDTLSRYFEEVLLIMGNHDGGLDQLAARERWPNVKLYDSKGVLMDINGKRTLLLHGNSRPDPEAFMEAEVLIMGHTHPAVVIQDEHGFVAKEPAIVKIKVDKGELGLKLYKQSMGGGELSIIVLPTANHLTVGVDVVSTLTTEFEAPRTLLRYIEPWRIQDRVEVYLTDLTYLGTLDLMRRLFSEKVDFDAM